MLIARDQAYRQQWINDPSLFPVTYITRGKPSWMSESQWDQAVAFMRGLAVPTDPEIISGLMGDTRCELAHEWAWSSVPGILVAGGYEPWCELILEKHRVDPDLVVDEGL